MLGRPVRAGKAVKVISVLQGPKELPRAQQHHKLPELPLRLLYTDRVFWALRRFAPELLGRICGTPKGFRASPAEQQALEWIMGPEARVRRAVAAFIRSHIPQGLVLR